MKTQKKIEGPPRSVVHSGQVPVNNVLFSSFLRSGLKYSWQQHSSPHNRLTMLQKVEVIVRPIPKKETTYTCSSWRQSSRVFVSRETHPRYWLCDKPETTMNVVWSALQWKADSSTSLLPVSKGRECLRFHPIQQHHHNNDLFTPNQEFNILVVVHFGRRVVVDTGTPRRVPTPDNGILAESHRIIHAGRTRFGKSSLCRSDWCRNGGSDFVYGWNGRGKGTRVSKLISLSLNFMDNE